MRDAATSTANSSWNRSEDISSRCRTSGGCDRLAGFWLLLPKKCQSILNDVRLRFRFRLSKLASGRSSLHISGVTSSPAFAHPPQERKLKSCRASSQAHAQSTRLRPPIESQRTSHAAKPANKPHHKAIA
jgi:hypothetical protein